MPYPPLSPKLNNCALHAFVPAITEEIDLYALNKPHFGHIQYYEKLKDDFVRYYKLPAPFSFKQWSDLLHSYTPHDRQIIMGPVLREFMRETAAASTQREFVDNVVVSDVADALEAVQRAEKALITAVEEARKADRAAPMVQTREEVEKADAFIKQKHAALRIAQDRFDVAYKAAETINANPRKHYLNSITEIGSDSASYRPLSPTEAHRFIGNPLGISLTYHKDEVSYPLVANDPIASIDMYHQGSNQGGHWELTPKAPSSSAYQQSTELEDLLPLLGENPQVNEAGLGLLSEHVRLRAQKVPSDAPAYQEIKNTANSIEKFLYNAQRVPTDIAKDLLGNTLSKPVVHFIQEYKPSYEVPASDANLALNDREVGRLLKMPPQEFLQEARAVKKAHEKEEANLETQRELQKLEQAMDAAEKHQYEETITHFIKPDSKTQANQGLLARYKLNIATLIKERDKVFSQGAKLNGKQDASDELAQEVQISEYKKVGM